MWNDGLWFIGKVMWFLHMGSDLGRPSQSLESGSDWINTGLGEGGVEICLPGLWEEQSYCTWNRRRKWVNTLEVIHIERGVWESGMCQASSPWPRGRSTQTAENMSSLVARMPIIWGPRDVSLTSPGWRGAVASTAPYSGSGPSKKPSGEWSDLIERTFSALGEQ